MIINIRQAITKDYYAIIIANQGALCMALVGAKV